MPPKNQNGTGDEANGVEERESNIVKLMSVNGIRRAGIRFPPGETVPVDLDDLTDDQKKLLDAEPDLRGVR